MKKLLVLLLCLTVLLFAGCEKDNPAATGNTTAPAETTVPTEETIPTEPTETDPPVPDTVSGIALADYTYVILLTVDRDAAVDVVGDYDDHYAVVKVDSGYGLIEKRLIRMEGAAAYEQWDGYARHGTKLYTNYHLLSDGAQDLSMNTQVRILDSFGDVCVVQYGETIGYALESQISRNYIQYTPSGGGSGGAGSDGGDISLGFQNSITFLSTVTPQTGEICGSAVVLVNDAEIILGWYDRDDEVNIVNEEGFAEEREGFYSVYLDGLYGYVRQNLVLKDGSGSYAQWDGYAKYKAVVYDNYYLAGNPVSELNTNTAVHVVCDLGNCYLVNIGEDIGYMNKDLVSETKIVYSGGGGNSGGEWSDPVL